jgi:hypothetical protein
MILGFAAVVEVFYSYLCKLFWLKDFVAAVFASGGGNNRIEGLRESCN